MRSALQGACRYPQRPDLLLPPPPVTELGQAKASISCCWTAAAWAPGLTDGQNQLLSIIKNDPGRPGPAQRARPCFRYRVDDWEKPAPGVPITSIHRTITAAFGSSYCERLHPGGRSARLHPADAPNRMLPRLEKLLRENNAGKMVQFSAFATGRVQGPELLRFKRFPA